VAVIPYGRGLLAKWHGIRPEAWSVPCTEDDTCPHCPNDPDPLFAGEHVFIEQHHASPPPAAPRPPIKPDWAYRSAA
jgi:hypothetical protein